MSNDVTAQVLAAEQARCKAMIDNDLQALKTILDDELSFHHATGAVDDKNAYLDKMAGGRITYKSIDWPECKVTDLGGGAVVTGKMLTAVSVDGVDKLLDNRVTAVWRTGDNNSWSLVVFQSTPIKT